MRHRSFLAKLPQSQYKLTLERLRAKLVPTTPAREVRRLKRVVTKRRASIVVNLGSRPERVPCVIVDISADGFRLRIGFPLRRGQLVEVIANEETNAVRCRVVWVGAPGSKYEGEAGLQAVAS